jgi:hypothetical protein
MTKEQIITKIVELKFPNSPIKRSLEARAIQRCGYYKETLLNELQNMPEYKSNQREQKLQLLGI